MFVLMPQCPRGCRDLGTRRFPGAAVTIDPL